MMRSILVAVGIVFVAGGDGLRAAGDPPRKSRVDSFFGVHFDFHAQGYDPVIGSNTTPAMVQALIDITKPDYFEIDTKGHPGYSSYPTRVGNHAGRFFGDPLRVWRETTAKNGVALYGHHSGILDDRACALHPDWRALNASGGVIGTMSLLGAYPAQLLIPQLVELACDYGLDGAWLDGDCWGCVMDYSPAFVERFRAETGLAKAPTSPSEPGWMAWRGLQRQIFREYERRYIREVKAAKPGFQFCCNWSFSPHMPEVPYDEVDFISGDICAGGCVDAARSCSRLFATQGKPWDLMSWSFFQWEQGKLDNPATRKPAVQLMREAACVIAQGGGYQAVFSQAPAGYPPVRDGSVDIEKVRLFGEVAKFCRARQRWSFKSKPVPQVGVLLSTEGTYARWDRENAGLFWWDRRAEGIVSALVECRYAVSVLVTRRLLEHLDEYPAVVVCEWPTLEEGLVDRLLDYARAGGGLFVVGTSKALFDAALEKTEGRTIPGPAGYSLTEYALGAGCVVTLDRNISEAYRGNPTAEIRSVVQTAMARVFPNPQVRVAGEPEVDVSLVRTAEGDLAVHLVNVSGPHRETQLIPEIVPTGPVELSVRLKARPCGVFLQPGDRAVDWTWKDGVVTLTVASVPIHEIVVFRNAAAHLTISK